MENAIERACALATGALVELADLPDEVREHQSLVIASEQVRPLREIEREYILAALQRNHGNRTLTAQQLKIGSATLFRKLKDYTDGPWSVPLLAEVARRCLELSGTS